MKWPECQVSGLRCPFSLPPNAYDDGPAPYTQNLRHLQSGSDGAPWDGYYATYNSAKLAVSHECGVWFEIRKRENGWEAHRPARLSLNLRNHPLDGVDMQALVASGEPLTRAPSRASSLTRPQEDPVPPSLEERLGNAGLTVEEARQLLEQAHSSAAEREGRPPRRHP
jgi:hypothetical protein